MKDVLDVLGQVTERLPGKCLSVVETQKSSGLDCSDEAPVRGVRGVYACVRACVFDKDCGECEILKTRCRLR